MMMKKTTKNAQGRIMTQPTLMEMLTMMIHIKNLTFSLSNHMTNQGAIQTNLWYHADFFS